MAAASATRGDKSASTSDIGTAGEAAAATIAALSMAGSPAATAGYRAAAAAAAAAPGGARAPGSFPGVGRAAELDTATKAAQAQAQAAQVNGFAAMMAQMGAMGQMGQMGSFPPPANWMATYHQFLSQMTAAAAAAQPAAGMAANPFAAMPMGAIPAGVVPAGHDGEHAHAGRGARVPGKRARRFVPPDGGARRARRAGERPSRGLRRGESRDGDGVTA